MRIGDAIRALQPGRKADAERRRLETVWSEAADDGPEAVPLPEYPRPQLVRENWRCLNGWWDYAIRRNGEAPGEPDGKILVPFSPESARSGVSRTLRPGETLWYRRVIRDIRPAAGHRLLLHFGAVDERCAVYWNGRKAGSHRNGYLPFTIDVTGRVRPGDNVLMVAVRDDTDAGCECRGKQTLRPGSMYYQAQSGIWQTVWLEEVPACYIREMRITPDVPGETVEIALTIVGAAGARAGLHVPGEESLPDIEVTLGGERRHFPRKPGNTVRIPVPEPRLWSPEDPYLYPLRVKVGEDEVESYFAMRSFGRGTDGKGRPCLLLNGKPYFYHGVLDQGYWPESLMTPPSDEAMIFDITEMKRAGFNTIRKHVTIGTARWYHHCDRIGMVVWQDMVSGGSPVHRLWQMYIPTALPAFGRMIRDHHYRFLSRANAPARARFERDLTRMVRCLGSVPCIGMWIIFNEGWGQFDSLRLTEALRREDPSRLIDHASGWFDQGGGDIRSVHNYFHELRVEKDERPCVLSEYGGINCRIPGHVMSEEEYGYRKSAEGAFAGDFSALMGEIARLREQGLAGAVYTQLSDIEEETNGLMTYDRRVVKI